MKKFWNERYAEKGFVYGEEPNVFFKEQLSKLKAGIILLPAEGEGRNAVYAASLGWEVHAFDSSDSGKIKALKLMEKAGVSFEYLIEDAITISYQENSFDVVALIYAHFPDPIRRITHQNVISWLKPGGKVILEAFNPDQLRNNSGGPKEGSLLYTTEMLEKDFKGMDIELLETTQIILEEGKYHDGRADIVRFIGSKKK